MKQLSNFVKIMPESDFESFDGADLVGSSAADLLPTENNLEFSEPPASARAGVLYEQSLELVCQKLSTNMRQRYPERSKVVVLVFDDAGTPALWGGNGYPVRLSINPKTDRDVIKLTRKATEPLF